MSELPDKMSVFHLEICINKKSFFKTIHAFSIQEAFKICDALYPNADDIDLAWLNLTTFILISKELITFKNLILALKEFIEFLSQLGEHVCTKFVPLKKNKTLDSNNLKTTSKMLKEIPQKINHKIIGYDTVRASNDSTFEAYKPIYERIFPLNTVYWDHSRSERIYLTSDTQGITCKGQFVEVETRRLGYLDTVDKEMFFELLAHNGYEIQDGKFMIHLNYGGVYMTEKGVIVIYLANGCHTCTNEIVDYKVTRPADTFETEAFFDCLKGNGFTYHPLHKCITESERYYYFPSYSLYNGFQPEKKKWINSDADKFYDKHLETFDTFAECANWCNVINKALQRDYPEIN